MTVVVSFQRAINVGRGRSVPMADLKAIYESIGARDVRSFLQSGNIIFATDGDAHALNGKIEAALAKRFGFPIPVINRTAAELRTTVKRNPFPKEAKADPGHLVVVFLALQPTKDERDALVEPPEGPERLKLIGADLYIHYAAGIGRSKLKLPLKTPGTARNWRTITKLLAMAEASAASGGPTNSQARARTLTSRRLESASPGMPTERAMAKGQQKPNKEKRKQKADKNKPKKGAASPMGMGSTPSSSGGGTMPPMKKM
jgi:uncharacterized protein (DUF1697 family)